MISKERMRRADTSTHPAVLTARGPAAIKFQVDLHSSSTREAPIFAGMPRPFLCWTFRGGAGGEAQGGAAELGVGGLDRRRLGDSARHIEHVLVRSEGRDECMHWETSRRESSICAHLLVRSFFWAEAEEELA